MKRRKLFAAVLTLALALASVGNVSAAETGSVIFEGEAEKFVTQVDGDEFENIMPGESRTLNIMISNDHSEEMKFYMSAEIFKNIAESGDKRAVYDFSIAKDDQVFFTAIIGGESGENISSGKEYLTKDNHILLDILKKGESSKVSITLSLDGDSADNAYQNQAGEIQLRFSVETPEGPATLLKKITKTVRTGDVLPIGIMIAAAGSLLLIIIILLKKRKGRMEDE